MFDVCFYCWLWQDVRYRWCFYFSTYQPPEFSDSRVIVFVFSVSGACTVTWLVPEVLVKILSDNRHISSGDYFLYLGATEEAQHKQPWFVWLGACSILPYALSLIFFKVLKARWESTKVYICSGNMETHSASLARTTFPGWKALLTAWHFLAQWHVCSLPPFSSLLAPWSSLARWT